MRNLLLLAGGFSLLLVIPQLGAVEVIEAQPTSIPDQTRYRTTRPSSENAGASNIYTGQEGAIAGTDAASQLFVEMQRLQSEVMQLRGLLEEQGYLIERLQQRRMDDYLEFDQRISDLIKLQIVVHPSLL